MSTSAVNSGHTVTPTSTVAATGIPSIAMYPIAFFQGRPDILCCRVYIRNTVYNVAAADSCSAALDTTGRLWVTGCNKSGELGQGNLVNLPSWAQWGTLTQIVEVRIASLGIFARTKAGNLYYAGYDTSGFLGTAKATYNTPTLVTTNVKAFDTGDDQALYLMVVKNDGTLWGGGLNTSGQLGLGNIVNVLGLQQVPGITTASSVSCDNQRGVSTGTCYIDTTGNVWFAGLNRTGIFGYTPSLNATTPITSFVKPTFGAQGTIVDVLYAQDQIVALTTTGTLWRAGAMAAGGLGHNIAGVWALQNSWAQMPIPDTVMAMRGYSSTTGVDGIQFLTATRGIIGYGEGQVTNTNTVFNQFDYSYRECGDLRSFDTGIYPIASLSQTF